MQMTRFEVDRDARLLLGAQWIAQAADGIVQAALAEKLILEPEATGSRLLAITALTLVPYSFFAPFLGVFVDRWARRSVLVYTNIGRGALLVIMALIVRSASTDAPLYVGLLLLLGIGRLFLTAKGAALPRVFHEHHLLEGNSLSGGGGMIAALTGGVLGVASVGVLETATTLGIAAGAYLLSSLLAAKLMDPLAHELTDLDIGRHLKVVWRDLKLGLHEVGRRAQARLPLVGIFVVRTIAMVAAFSAIVIIKEEFPEVGGRGERLAASALALGAAGVGAFLGAVIAPALRRRWPEPHLMLGGFVLAGLGIALLGGIQSIPAVLGLTFLGGLGGFIAKVSVDTLLQAALPDDFRGRGFAIYDVIYNLASVGAAALVLFAEDDLRIFLIAAGSVTLAFAWLLDRAMRAAGLFDARVGPNGPSLG